MMTRPPTPRHQPPHDPRERCLVAALRRRGMFVTAGWLRDGRRNRRYRHGRIVEKVRTA